MKLVVCRSLLRSPGPKPLLICPLLIFRHHSTIISPRPGHPSILWHLPASPCPFVRVRRTLSCFYFFSGSDPCSRNVWLVWCNKEAERAKARKVRLAVYRGRCVRTQPLTALQTLWTAHQGLTKRRVQHRAAIRLVKMSRRSISLIWNSKPITSKLEVTILRQHHKLNAGQKS